MSLSNYLNKIGYRPDLSDGKFQKFEKALFNYLKEDLYLKFCSLREKSGSEEDITTFIGNDLRLLRLVISGQIKISISLTEGILNILKERKYSSLNILDLGGAEGWASSYINNQLNFNATIDVVEKNPIFAPLNDAITIHHVSYKDFNPIKKYDLIISILGAPSINFIELFDCIKRSIGSKGIALLGLRIPSISDYLNSIELLNNHGLFVEKKFTRKITVFGEEMTILYLTPSDLINTTNDKLMLSRSSFMNYPNPKRIYGYEANLFSKFILNGKIIFNDKIEWEDGSSFTVELIEYEEIFYRKTSNSYGDTVIEYPVEKDDIFNKTENQIKRMTEENLWNNTK